MTCDTPIKWPAPDQIEVFGQGEDLKVRAEWIKSGTWCFYNLAGYERIGEVDRFVVADPSGTLFEYDFPANLWFGFRPGQRPRRLPAEMCRDAETLRMLGFTR